MKFNVKNLTVAQRGFFAGLKSKLVKRGVVDQSLKTDGKLTEDIFRQWCASNGYIVEKIDTTEKFITFRVGRPVQAAPIEEVKPAA